MMRSDAGLLAGQWYGSYTYSALYGEKVGGEKVTFSFLIEPDSPSQFHGKCIELEGVGASTEVSRIKGSFDGRFIRFTKEYDTNTSIDDDGVTSTYEDEWIYQLLYIGKYHPETNSFAGAWEIREETKESNADASPIHGSGSWEMSRSDIA